MIILINAFLVASFLFLCAAAMGQEPPIKLDLANLAIYFSLIGTAFFLINLDWMKNVDLTQKVNQSPEDLPSYLNKRLFGGYPYVFSIRPGSGIQVSGARLAKLYAVRNRSLAEVLTAYFDETYLMLFALILVALPFLFADQQAPSYLGLVNRFWFGFGLVGWLLTSVWFSCLSIWILRIRCVFLQKKIQKGE